VWERRGKWRRMEERRGKVRKQTDVPLQILTLYQHPGERYQHGGHESVHLVHTIYTFPMSYIKVHPWMASEK
jgi:hypothetical protein